MPSTCTVAQQPFGVCLNLFYQILIQRHCKSEFRYNPMHSLSQRCIASKTASRREMRLRRVSIQGYPALLPGTPEALGDFCLNTANIYPERLSPADNLHLHQVNKRWNPPKKKTVKWLICRCKRGRAVYTQRGATNLLLPQPPPAATSVPLWPPANPICSHHHQRPSPG